MIKKNIAFLVAATACIFPAAILADPEECRDAIDSYDSSLDDISVAMKSYVACLDDSKGRDDCSIEFQQLQSAQDDFASAVSDYQDECGN